MPLAESFGLTKTVGGIRQKAFDKCALLCHLGCSLITLQKVSGLRKYKILLENEL